MKIKIGTGRLTIEQLCAATGGTAVGTMVPTASFSHICTDSREAVGDGECLFVAIPGEKTDGHAYMAAALEGGCSFFLCQRVPEGMPARPFAAVLVEDTVAALGALAKYYDAGRKHVTVAVTGSVGKTTTKEMISAVLEEEYRVFKTGANHNSTLGMPLSLLEITPNENAAVLEMGMSARGEISFMSRIACPDIACVTNIGSSHLEALGSRENICRAKMEIMDGMSPEGLLILNGDEILLWGQRDLPVKGIFVALENPAADYGALRIRYGETYTDFDVREGIEVHTDFRVNAVGKHYVYNALFAIAAARRLGLCMNTIRNGLEKFRNIAMRQNIYEYRGITIIEDCYNASPESMRAAADTLATLSEKKAGARMVALLGDMRELGTDSPLLHRNVGAYMARKGLGLLYCVGTLAKDIALGAAGQMKDENIHVCLDCSEIDIISREVAALLRPGDILLAKASRAVGAEKILEKIKEKL